MYSFILLAVTFIITMAPSFINEDVLVEFAYDIIHLADRATIMLLSSYILFNVTSNRWYSKGVCASIIIANIIFVVRYLYPNETEAVANYLEQWISYDGRGRE